MRSIENLVRAILREARIRLGTPPRIRRVLHGNEETALNPDPFDLVERDVIPRVVV
jgi:hypothetical protein